MRLFKLCRAGLYAALVLTACTGSTTDGARDLAATDFNLFVGVDRPEITIRLHADPDVVSRGDTVSFTARAHNSTAAEVIIGGQCGPAMDVLIRSPIGRINSVLELMVGRNADFTCELRREHFAPAHDSTTTRLWWVAPKSGEYLARAGARDALGNAVDDVSEPIRIRVR